MNFRDFGVLTMTRFLDIAIVCEVKGDVVMAEKVAAKAVECKRNCQGTDFPNYGRYVEVLARLRAKMGRR
jgi:hypothetical protein